MSKAIESPLAKSAVVALVTLLAKGASFLAAALVARALAPVEMGFLDLAIFIFMSFLPLGSLNVNTAATIFISTAKDKNALAFSIFALLALLYGFISLLALFLLPVLLGYLGVELAVLPLLIVAASFLFVLHTYSLSAFQGLENFKSYSIILALQPFIFLGIQLLVRLNGYFLPLFSTTASGVLTAYILSYFIPALVAVYFLASKKVSIELKPALAVFSYAVKQLWIVALLGAVVGLYLRSLVFINDPVNNAILRILDQYSQLLVIPVSAFLVVIFPKVSQTASNKQNYSEIFLWFRKYSAIVITTGVAMSVFGLVLLPFIFGAKYVSAVPFIGFYGLFIIVSLLYSFAGQVSLANPKWTHFWRNTAILLNLFNVGFALLLPKLGVIETIGIYLFNTIVGLMIFVIGTRSELGLHKLFLQNFAPISIALLGLVSMSIFLDAAVAIGAVSFALLVLAIHFSGFVTFREARDIFLSAGKAHLAKLREVPEILKFR